MALGRKHCPGRPTSLGYKTQTRRRGYLSWKHSRNACTFEPWCAALTLKHCSGLVSRTDHK
eukprot:6181440-Prorocentrum_lima.AAC.1